MEERGVRNVEAPGSKPGFSTQVLKRVLSSVVELGIADPAVTGSNPVVPLRAVVRQQRDLNPRGQSPCDF